MIDLHALQRDNATLRERNEQLVREAEDAAQAFDALARGQVDAVANGTSAPLLLRAAQEELRASRLLLRAIFDSTLDAVVLSDDDGLCVDANPAACTLFALPRAELVGRRLAELVEPGTGHPDLPPLRTIGRMAGVFALRRRDGPPATLEYSAVADIVPGTHLSILRDISDRLTAEDAVRRNEALFRAVIEKSAEVISLTEADGSTRYLTPSAWRLLGWTDDEMASHTLREQVIPEDRVRVEAEHERLMRTGARDMAMEIRVRHRDGSLRWVESTGTNLLDDPNVRAIVGNYRDITERKHAEEALRASRNRLEEAQAIAHVGSWQVGLGADATAHGSRECYVVLGLPPETRFTLQALFACLHPADHQRVERAVRTAYEREESFDLEHRIQRADGSTGWVHTRAVIERDAAGSAIRMLGTVQDITERRTALEALSTSEALLRIAGQNAKLGGWSLTLPETLTWSDQVCEIHEVPIGATPTVAQALHYYAPESHATISDAVTRCARDGTPFDLELQIVTAHGRRVWVRVIGSAQRDATGTITSIRGAFQDIDERRKLQDQLRQAQKMEAVGRLAGGVAHDFNNLLSVILSYSQFAIEDLNPGDPLRDDMVQIDQAGKRAADLTRQLLAFSRQQVLSSRVLDLNQIIMPMERMLRRLLGEDVTLSLIPASTLGRVLADAGQLEQVIMNLAVNARDAMPGGRTLVIETSDVLVEAGFVGGPSGIVPGHYVTLAVSDTGSGMDAATCSRIFEPFFTTKGPGKGTGLGLATVFGIVRQSAGYVSVSSEVGHGTTFKVYLPMTDRPADARPAGATPVVLRGSETILLVEDEEQVRVVASAILRRNGYKVLESSNGGEAFLVSKSFGGPIDLLLTDVVMPRMSGRMIAEELTPLRPDLKVLYASGYTDDAIIHHGVLAEGVAFIQKPFTPDALLHKVREVLDAPRPG